MAGSRSPGGVSARPPPPGQRLTRPRVAEEEERTAVDPGPPQPEVRAPWEERTVAEKGSQSPRGGSEEITAAGQEDSGQFLVDTGVTQDEGAAKRRMAA